ncbi:hypothetical protein P154DRAFT_453585 [Amniculicola lignicola CBS 123094]|uniref:F-box domain-containing protein n=1 Tax=Amniculicola lignicola CBS 123094 TaxID=1392246 RepID=A0A6A5X5A3_9PLEO|nr:hypothetical protein P154DRAFT_453585 [Amniculicola lignicola CBS 123094]
MVVIADLGDDTPAPVGKPIHHSIAPESTYLGDIDEENGEPARPNPNVNGFSAALSCYPIVRQLASQLDLNTMHNLSRTCRQFRANLLEYRDQLIKRTMHCVFEDADMGTRLAWRLQEGRGRFAETRTLTSGKIGRCARDMVGECQRCGTVVCRNCTIKPPATPTLKARHRRLCRTCTKAPIALLTAPLRERPASSGASTPSQPRPDLHSGKTARAFTAAAFGRAPCCCVDMVWLCQACGQHLKNADTAYNRSWTFRTRYTHFLGGVGTGLGEGNEGIQCGRGSNCLAGRIVEHEVECDPDTQASLESSGHGRWRGTSYHAQEIEGIGGTIKLKVKKQVRVGDCVKVYEKERDSSLRWLEPEVEGRTRSWCSWCERVVLGEKDKDDYQSSRPWSSGSSSASSA